MPPCRRNTYTGFEGAKSIALMERGLKIPFEPRQKEALSMETDPVCGLVVGRYWAQEAGDYLGRLFYFCSKDCKRAFDRDPERYTGVLEQIECLREECNRT